MAGSSRFSQSSQQESQPDNESRRYSQNHRSPQQRKQLLRNAVINAHALENNVNTNTITHLEEMIAEVDEINQEGTIEEKIKDQGEVILDSQIMTISSDVIKKCTYSLSKDLNAYDPMEFAEKIKLYLNRMPDSILDEELDWSLLGKDVIKNFKRTPEFQMIMGTLQLIARRENRRVGPRGRAQRDPQAATSRPEKVKNVDKTEESVEQTVNAIRTLIKDYYKQNHKPLEFFSLVLHPTDFGKTIENILHVSFLVRDGHIKCEKNEQDGLLEVLPTSKEFRAQNTKKPNIQNVVTLNMGQWKELVTAYNLTTPMIDLRK